jgi:hypothetical protein
VAIEDAPCDPNAWAILGHSVEQLVGFDVAHWIRCLRANPLIVLGRLDEADLWLARLMQIEETRIEPVVQYIPHWLAVELAWHRGDAARARWHAAQVVRFAQQSAVPFVSVKALLCEAMAASADRDFAAAEQHCLSALATARKSGAGLDYEARLLALLADTHVRAGNSEQAVRAAAEATETARRRTDRYAECHALIAGAMALAVEGEVERRREAMKQLSLADRLIVRTGASVLHPLRERAQLLVDTGQLSWS